MRYHARRMARILVTNDDGIYSEGLRKLADGAAAKSATCRSSRPTANRARPRTRSRSTVRCACCRSETDEWIVDGTPADCVNLAILKLMKDARPDLIVSGINFGPNLGDDVTYSGTISAAFEGALLNIPSIAFSALVGEAFLVRPLRRSSRSSSSRIALEQHRDPHIILNVNFPVGEFRGVRITPLGNRIYTEGVIERLDPRGRSYYWIGGEPPIWHPGEEPTSKRCRTASSPSRRCTSTSPTTNRSRDSSLSRRCLATTPTPRKR